MTPPRPLPPGFLARPIAHRGLHARAAGRIENSASAFGAAVAAGYGIECDVQASRDGEAMVFHDFTLDRLTGETGPLDARDAAALATIPLAEGPDRIGTLAGLFDLVAGRVPLVVEVKSRFNGDTRLAGRIAALARAYAGPLVFKSFDPAQIMALKAAGIETPLGIVGMARYDYPDYAHLDEAARHALANLLHFTESRPDFLSWHHLALPSAGPYLCRSVLGRPVMGWTIRSPEEARRAAPHLDQIVFEGFLPD
jgi:glycerophosphoryl diester phosphodiesterase